MKNLFVLMLAAMVFVACNNDGDSETAIDFGALTHEEILTTKGGLDYLVSLGASYDRNALSKRLESETLDTRENQIWTLVDNDWQMDYAFGGGSSTIYLLQNATTLRACFLLGVQTKDGGLIDMAVYRDVKVVGDPFSQLLADLSGDWSVIAYVGDYVICERDNMWGSERIVAKFCNNRDEVLERYTVDYATIDPSLIIPE
ncbi:MAG: hypothetical protein IKD24_04720 [Alistipes sp.]|nr:hypothetical protein [Alistipes sp.]